MTGIQVIQLKESSTVLYLPRYCGRCTVPFRLLFLPTKCKRACDAIYVSLAIGSAWQCVPLLFFGRQLYLDQNRYHKLLAPKLVVTPSVMSPCTAIYPGVTSQVGQCWLVPQKADVGDNPLFGFHAGLP